MPVKIIVPEHVNFPGHSPGYVIVYGISPCPDNTERCKNKNMNLSYDLKLWIPTESTKALQSIG